MSADGMSHASEMDRTVELNLQLLGALEKTWVANLRTAGRLVTEASELMERRQQAHHEFLSQCHGCSAPNEFLTAQCGFIQHLVDDYAGYCDRLLRGFMELNDEYRDRANNLATVVSSHRDHSASATHTRIAQEAKRAA